MKIKMLPLQMGLSWCRLAQTKHQAKQTVGLSHKQTNNAESKKNVTCNCWREESSIITVAMEMSPTLNNRRANMLPAKRHITANTRSCLKTQIMHTHKNSTYKLSSFYDSMGVGANISLIIYVHLLTWIRTQSCRLF
jgi:hypothetical protein